MRKIVKILHTIAAAGLIGGLASYAILLATAPQGSAEAYAELRQSIVALANFVLLPSLAAALVTGLLSMVVHPPFLDKGWAWIKALLGLSMFEATLMVIGGAARHGADVARQVADGAAGPEAIAAAMQHEWWALGGVTALSIANVVLGVWRPRIMKTSPAV